MTTASILEQLRCDVSRCQGQCHDNCILSFVYMSVSRSETKVKIVCSLQVRTPRPGAVPTRWRSSPNRTPACAPWRRTPTRRSPGVLRRSPTNTCAGEGLCFDKSLFFCSNLSPDHMKDRKFEWKKVKNVKSEVSLVFERWSVRSLTFNVNSTRGRMFLRMRIRLQHDLCFTIAVSTQVQCLASKS